MKWLRRWKTFWLEFQRFAFPLFLLSVSTWANCYLFKGRKMWMTFDFVCFPKTLPISPFFKLVISWNEIICISVFPSTKFWAIYFYVIFERQFLCCFIVCFFAGKHNVLIYFTTLVDSLWLWLPLPTVTFREIKSSLTFFKIRWICNKVDGFMPLELQLF